MLFSTFVLFCSLLVVNALTLEERAAGGYVQKPSGSASFTMYSGCGAPGDDNHCSHLGRPVTNKKCFDNSMWQDGGEWVHGSNKPTCLWCPFRRWGWRCLRSLFLFDRQQRPIFARFYWPFQQHCGQGDKSLVNILDAIE